MKLYVGNLPYTVSNRELEELFADYGNIISAKVITDARSGRSKGFGFVELEAQQEGERAIEEINGREIKGRAVVVSEARPKPEGESRGPRGPRGGGGRPPRDRDDY